MDQILKFLGLSPEGSSTGATLPLGVIVVLFLAAAGAESIASARWWPAYVRSGFPILRLSFGLPPAVSDLPADSLLAQSFGTGWMLRMLFRQLSDTEMAFREVQVGYAAVRYFPVMHGLIRFHVDQRRGEVVGRANYSALLLLLLIMASVAILAPPEWRLRAIPALVGGLVVTPYCIQAYRYNKVRKVVGDYVDACVMAAAAPRVERT